LSNEPTARVVLVYGSRSDDAVIFRGELDDLAARHADRFVVRHVIGDRMDRDRLARELDALSVAGDARFFVCGPEPMMNEARALLVDARGVAKDRVHEERFTSPHLRSTKHAGVNGEHAVFVSAGGVERRVLVAAGQTMLEAGLEANVAMPFSCAM